MTALNLAAHEVPLIGRHLIEASAGTGKTFNITRLYLRLLLEQELTVQQILVMTFTKAATEEIKGRIDSFLRETVVNWDTLITEDVFFRSIAKKISKHKASLLIRQALLFLDEASIFTIHGFCQRVLTQHAFTTNVAFNAQLESDGIELELAACRDWYRKLAIDDQESFLKLVELCATPESFHQQFVKAIRHDGVLTLQTEADLIADCLSQVKCARRDIDSNELLLNECLVDVKKGADKQKRIDERQALLDWLDGAELDDSVLFTEFPDAFIDGRRFSRSKKKNEIIAAISNVSELKNKLKYLATNAKRARAMHVIHAGLGQLKLLISRSKVQANTLTFDDLIGRLAACLSNRELAQVLCRQFPAALVDEFQDTDAKQFSILEAIYSEQDQSCLFMIGDPKQAIYGFRGGDVFAYLTARKGCDFQWVMDTNWRSSVQMIAGYNRLFYGNPLTSEASNVFGYGIPYLPVKASPKANSKTILEDSYKALQFIHFDGQEGKPVKQTFRSTMAKWCAQEISRLIADSEIEARDIAILVRDGTEGDSVKQALAEIGLASVYLSNRANLFESVQAKQLMLILRAILHVEDEQLFIAGLSTELLAVNPNELIKLQKDDIGWQALKYDFVALREIWRNKSFITMALKLMHDHMKISSDNADRVLTNVLHLFELLQSASQRHHQPDELLHWFKQECVIDTVRSEAELRLESEDNLIQIVTQHGSKGLEYPIVFIPFSTRYKNPLKFGNKNISVIEYHDETERLVLSLDAAADHKALMAEEQYAESVRLLYVAITRAEQRCYLLTAPFDNYEKSPLGKTLLLSEGDEVATSLRALSDEMPDAIGYKGITFSELEGEEGEVELSPVYTPLEDCDVEPASFGGSIERDWWLSSFTALSRNLRHAGISSPDRDQDDVPLSTLQQLGAKIDDCIQFSLVRGASVGNFLHDILENLNFESPDWQSALYWPMKKYGSTITQDEADQIINWLGKLVTSPLSLTDNITLSGLSEGRVLKEMEFYFPMKSVNTRALTQLLSRHRESERHHTMGKISHVILPALPELKGMMHGFVDLILEYEGRYFVCDYKSNYLGADIQQYQPHELRANIEAHNYDLQYLIYSLALHRYLRFSLEDYSVSRHFGGVYYLYLRGMGHDNAPEQSGIYYRALGENIINRLDTIFDGKSTSSESKEILC